MEKIQLYIEPKDFDFGLIHQIISQEFRLNELVEIIDAASYKTSSNALLIHKNAIIVTPQWTNNQPPVLLPEVFGFSDKNLLGIIFYLLGNMEKTAFYFSENDYLLLLTALYDSLKKGEIIEEKFMQLLQQNDFANYTIAHNAAIANHYGNPAADFEKIAALYEQTLSLSSFDEAWAFTAKQYATLLSDVSLYSQASKVLAEFLNSDNLSEEANFAIKTAFCHNEIKQLSAPYNTTLMTALKNDLWECLKFYKSEKRSIDKAFVLMDASYIATISESYSEALGYIQRAVKIFDEEELLEFSAQAQFQKANLLYTWAQQGNPQFFSQAVNACKTALNVFTRENAPQVFADIHHLLGLIYSEIPDEIKKKSLWAGVSVSSFAEALSFYNKQNFPYEYGVICTNQGNAYLKYPIAIHSDNNAKALEWYREALSVRDAEKYPTERAITLLNYIEAAWSVGGEKEFDEALFSDMFAKANEVKTLNVNDDLKASANQHLEDLLQLEKEQKIINS